MPWTWRLSGPPLLQHDLEPSRVLALSRKDAAWLAYVALEPLAVCRVQALLVWPEADERTALNSLRQRVHRLRKATGARLVDMGATMSLAADLRPHREDLQALLRQTPEAPVAPLLAGLAYDAEPEFAAWLTMRRQQQVQAVVAMHAELADAAEGAGEWLRALRHAHQLLVCDPFSEHHHRRLMRLHYLRGDTAAAVAAFEAGERALREELGVRPSAETLALLRTVEAGQTAAAGALATVQLPASLLRPPRLVGRDKALAELGLASRQAQIAVVLGEAGMGKTRLLQAHLAARPETSRLVAARPGDGIVPFALLRRVLWTLHPDGDDPAVPTTAARRQRTTLQDALQDAVARGLQVLAIDDIHFADDASVELLLDLALGVSLPGLGWLFAQRPDVADVSPRARLLAQAPQARFVELLPWTQAQLTDFVASLDIAGLDAAALADGLAQRTGGNPLFVIETLRATLAGHNSPGTPAALARPAGLAHLIDARLRRLSRQALTLARVAAVAAPDFDLALAEAVLGVPALALADAWQELEAAQVLRGEAFAHDLVHDALLRATPQVIAAHLHRQVAALLAHRRVAPARLAEHWLAGGEPGRAALAFLSAAGMAESAGRPREQAELLARCAAAHRAAGDSDAALRVEVERVAPLLQAAGAQAGLAAADEAVEASRASPQLAHAHARALAGRAMALQWGGRAAEAAAAAQQALDLAPSTDSELCATATAMLAHACAAQGDVDAALALMLPWQARMDGIGDARVRCDFFGNLTNLLMQASRNRQALDSARLHLHCAQQAGRAGEQVAALMTLSNLCGRRGDLEQAVLHGRAANGLMPESGQADMLAAWNRATLGFWLAGAGQFDEALQLLEVAVAALAHGSAAHLGMAQGLLARVWLTLGQTARAVTLARTMPEMPAGRLRAGQLALKARIEQLLGGDAIPLYQAAVAEAPSDRDFSRMGAEVVLAADVGDAAKLLALQQRAEELDFHPIATEAATLRLPLLAVGLDPPTVATAEQRVLAARLPAYYPPEQLSRCAAAWRRLDREADAQRCDQAALDWVHKTALPHVPPPFVDSFLQRNPVNAALRARLRAKP